MFIILLCKDDDDAVETDSLYESEEEKSLVSEEAFSVESVEEEEEEEGEEEETEEETTEEDEEEELSDCFDYVQEPFCKMIIPDRSADYLNFELDFCQLLICFTLLFWLLFNSIMKSLNEWQSRVSRFFSRPPGLMFHFGYSFI